MADLNCLVVEDEPGIGWAIRRLLEGTGAGVAIAVSGARAMQYLERGNYSVIFLDVKLPDTDGFELAGVIHSIRPGIPIVIISAYFYPDDPKVQQMLARGVARRFIAKPFRHEEVLGAVRELLSPPAPWNARHSAHPTAVRARPTLPSTPGRIP